MKIESSTVHFDTSHRAAQRAEVRETLRAWMGTEPPPPQEDGDVVAISAAARMAAAAAAPPDVPAPAEAQAIDNAIESAENDPVLYFIKLVVEMMTGMRMKTVSPEDVRPDPASEEHAHPEHPQHPHAVPPGRAGFGIEYDRHEVREESELTTFHAQAVIRTADGKEISLTLDLSMYRSYREESFVSLRAGDAVRKDPLVINFGGTAAQLQERRFSFDIDGDGKAEQVPLLSGNSGYLALDRNGNGKIDSGKELFGAASGDGFAELAALDSDGNGWIDDNDPVFAQLRLWVQNDKGGTLDSAKSHGIGALYLGRAQTPFALKGADNQALGEVRNTGIYLAENGAAGTMQQIDVMI